MKIHLFFNTFCKIGLSKLTSIFDSILVSTCLHFPSKNRSKLDHNWNLEGIDFLIDFYINFFIDFPSIWDANLELCWPLRLLQDASKTPPRRLPRRSARHFSLLVDFWSIFGRFLIDLGSIFGWCSIDFWSIWGWFLKGFGPLFFLMIFHDVG